MRVGAVATKVASRQHARFLRTLQSLGGTVHPLPFVHGAFDCVFAKDNAIVVERGDGRREALLAHPRHAERRSEQEARAVALSRMAIRVLDVAHSPLEGGDVVMLPGGRDAFLGYGFRSSTSAAKDLERFLDGTVTLVELRDPLLYHLDMAVSVLSDGTALVCGDALTEAGLRAIEQHPLVRFVIRLERAEALRFGANLVQVGRSIVWAADAPVATHALQRRGYDVHRVELDQFHLAGGSAACLVSRIHPQGAAMRSNMTDEAPPSAAA